MGRVLGWEVGRSVGIKAGACVRMGVRVLKLEWLGDGRHYLLGSVGELDGRHRLIHTVTRRGQSGDHPRLGVPAQRVL